MREKIGQIIKVIVGWGIYITLIAGGLTFFGFVIALIIGGGKDGTGHQMAVFIQGTLFPFIIRLASFTVFLGLIGMYVNKQRALSLMSDKADADWEIADAKRAEAE